jgi:hypothetical protein
MDQRDLIAKRESLGGQIVDYTKQLQDKEKELQKVLGRVALAEQKIKEVEAEYDIYVKQEKALEAFEMVSAATTQLPKNSPGMRCLASAITHDTFSVSIRCSAETPENSVSPKACRERELVIGQLPWVRNLQSLSITGVKLDTNDMDILSKLPKLTELSLINCGLDDTCIAHLTLMPSLKSLDLSCNPASNVCGYNGQCPLAKLSIHNSAFSDKELARLLLHTPAIEEIDAQDSSLGDSALAAISSDGVKEIYVINSNVTLAGCKALIERIDPERLFVADSVVGSSAGDLRQFLKSKSLKCRVFTAEKPIKLHKHIILPPAGVAISGDQ